jgi:hypothetical protein
VSGEGQTGPQGDSAAVLWARRCDDCGWLDQSSEWAGEQAAREEGAGAWCCRRCGGESFSVVSTVGG